MKFYVLVSYNIRSFQKCIHYIPREDLVVVINARFNEYLIPLEEYCDENDITYHVTESDGTPATGKNSVLKLFLESGEDYMMMIDGDDFITPYGVKYYKELAQTPAPPDVVVLYKQSSVSHIDVDLYNLNTTADDLVNYELTYPLDKSDPELHKMSYDTLVTYFYKHYGVDMKTSKRWADARLEFNDTMNLYSEDYEYMTRMVFFSRKAAEKMHFDNQLVIGEDTIQCLKLKRMWADNEIVMMRKNDSHRPTYIMNREQDGICIAMQKRIHWNWLFPFLDKVKAIDLPPANIPLPELVVDN